MDKKVLMGKYEMGQLIGQGNFGRVYYGKHIVTDESVAIKNMYKDQVKKAGMMEQIKREISVMRPVRHPNIVRIVEVMATKTKIYLVMEYLKGGELFTLVEKGKLHESLARKYFQQLMSAVDYCHSRGVCHRDLKLQNLLLDENGDLKVPDFGLSAFPGQAHNEGLLYTLCGAPAYVAPEILKRKMYDGACYGRCQVTFRNGIFSSNSHHADQSSQQPNHTAPTEIQRFCLTCTCTCTS